MTDTSFVGLAGHVQGRVPTRYNGAALAPAPAALSGDRRYDPPATGTVVDNARVLFKVAPDAPDQPMTGARVRLHNLRTGACEWQGVSDAQGYYHPRNLQVGQRYVPVAIDLQGNFECVAAGPVVAVEPAP